MIDTKPAPESSGKVIAQHPRAGTELAPGSSVHLVVSEGWPTVPFFMSFSGYRIAVAKRMLRNRGLGVGEVRWRYDPFYSLYSPDKVFGSRPKSGTHVRPGRAVALFVAKPYTCTPGYSPCIRPGPDDVDCADGSGDGPRYVSGPVTVTGSDPYGLDGDNDGVGCE